MSFARGVGMFANRLMGEVDGGIKTFPQLLNQGLEGRLD